MASSGFQHILRNFFKKKFQNVFSTKQINLTGNLSIKKYHKKIDLNQGKGVKKNFKILKGGVANNQMKANLSSPSQ